METLFTGKIIWASRKIKEGKKKVLVSSRLELFFAKMEKKNECYHYS